MGFTWKWLPGSVWRKHADSQWFSTVAFGMWVLGHSSASCYSAAKSRAPYCFITLSKWLLHHCCSTTQLRDVMTLRLYCMWLITGLHMQNWKIHCHFELSYMWVVTSGQWHFSEPCFRWGAMIARGSSCLWGSTVCAMLCRERDWVYQIRWIYSPLSLPGIISKVLPSGSTRMSEFIASWQQSQAKAFANNGWAKSCSTYCIRCTYII